MTQYILISNGDENLDYAIDTDAEREAARAALVAAGETSAAIWAGDPADPSSYVTGSRFGTEAGTLELLCAGHTVSDARRDTLARGIALGAAEGTLAALRDAGRVSRGNAIVLPAHRLEGLSRGKGWARKGRGNNVEWGDKTEGGYRVGPGHWVVGGNDGFSRKGETTWDVEHIQVGTETWTIAD